MTLLANEQSTTLKFRDQNGSSKKWHRSILLVSHELTNTGAPRVLYYVAKHLLEAGDSPVVVSPTPGALQTMFENLGIPVIIKPLLFSGHKSILKFTRRFDCIIVNTIVSWPIVHQIQKANKNIPVLWYLHESNLIPEVIHENPLIKEVLKNARHILAGSPRVARFVSPFNPDIQILLYGVPDVAQSAIESSCCGDASSIPVKPVVFSVVGSVVPHKGQDIFVKAAIELEKKASNLAQFNIIGRTHDASWTAQLKTMASHYPNICFLGELDFNACLKAMKLSDVIVCPSRHDALSMVAVDGLCLGKVVICSDETGIGDFITPGVNGMIVPSESVDDLVDVMHQLLKDPILRQKMGIEARKLFLNKFSEQNFAGHIKTLVQATRLAEKSHRFGIISRLFGVFRRKG